MAYGYPGLGYGFGLEGPHKRRRSKRRLIMGCAAVAIGCALSGAAFFFGGVI